MKRASVAAAISSIALIAVGCGSSSHKTAASKSSAASGAPASNSSSSGGGYGPYSSGGATGGTTTGASTAASAAANGSASTAVKLTTKQHGKLGMILAGGPKELTVYMFEGDTTGRSNCNSVCTSIWPPVTTAGASAVGGAAMQSDVSTVTRSDGSKQLAYKGHPLYYFTRDKDSGDAYGEGVHGFGHDWYALAPSGKKVDNS